MIPRCKNPDLFYRMASRSFSCKNHLWYAVFTVVPLGTGQLTRILEESKKMMSITFPAPCLRLAFSGRGDPLLRHWAAFRFSSGVPGVRPYFTATNNAIEEVFCLFTITTEIGMIDIGGPFLSSVPLWGVESISQRSSFFAKFFDENAINSALRNSGDRFYFFNNTSLGFFYSDLRNTQILLRSCAFWSSWSFFVFHVISTLKNFGNPFPHNLNRWRWVSENCMLFVNFCRLLQR